MNIVEKQPTLFKITIKPLNVVGLVNILHRFVYRTFCRIYFCVFILIQVQVRIYKFIYKSFFFSNNYLYRVTFSLKASEKTKSKSISA